MIKHENGQMQMSGSTVDNVMDLAAIIRGCRDAFTDRHGADVADKLITFAGKVAFVDEDDMTDETAKQFGDMFIAIANGEEV